MNRNILLPPSANAEVRLRQRIAGLDERVTTEQAVSGGRSVVDHLVLAAPWRAYAGGTGTTSWGQPRYVREPSYVVHLEGLIDKSGNDWFASDLIGTLPAGFRPVLQQLFMVPFHDGVNAGLMRVDVHQTGNIYAVLATAGIGTTVSYLALSGIQFLAKRTA